MGKTIASLFAAMVISSPVASQTQEVWQGALASDRVFRSIR